MTTKKVVYSSEKSHMTGGSYPLVVMNEGTPEWSGTVGNLADQIPAGEILDFLLSDPSRSQGRRGNIQLNFGMAGGQSHTPRSPESIAENAGTAFPSWLQGSRHHLVVQLMQIGTKIAEELGFPWMDPGVSVAYERRLLMGVHKCLGIKEIRLEHCTLFFNKIDGTVCVKDHADLENCRKLPNVLTYAKILHRLDE